jgi:hypothetical protein
MCDASDRRYPNDEIVFLARREDFVVNYRLLGAFVTVAIGIQPLSAASDPQHGPTKEILLPPQTGSHIPHRIRVPVESQASEASAKKKKKESKKKESKQRSSKPSPTPEPKREKPAKSSTQTPERFR